MIAQCPQCGWSQSVKESAKGRRARCPDCDGIFRINPSHPDAAAPRGHERNAFDSKDVGEPPAGGRDGTVWAVASLACGAISLMLFWSIFPVFQVLWVAYPMVIFSIGAVVFAEIHRMRNPGKKALGGLILGIFSLLLSAVMGSGLIASALIEERIGKNLTEARGLRGLETLQEIIEEMEDWRY